jgi:hypothetical protein
VLSFEHVVGHHAVHVIGIDRAGRTKKFIFKFKKNVDRVSTCNTKHGKKKEEKKQKKKSSDLMRTILFVDIVASPGRR